jgi:hypothetical protein
MGVWCDSSQPINEKSGVIGNCKWGMEGFKTGGSRRLGFVCSLDRGRLMGVTDCSMRQLRISVGWVSGFFA